MDDDGPGGTDDLYALDPNDFVAGRNDLAKALRKAGDRRQADEVAKLRRPTPAAWAVNQLVRRHRPEVEELVRRGEALRAAQDDALAGGEPGDLRQAGRARRDAVAGLAERAEELLTARGGTAGAHAGEVTATLEAASLDAGAAAEVLGGRLAAELRPPSGFGVFDLPAGAPAPKRAPAAPEADPAPDDGRQRRRDEAEQAVVDARRRWEERSEQARAVLERVAAGRRAAQDAEGEVARLEDLVAEAQRRLRGAVREAELAEDAASRAEDGVARAAAALRDAEKARAALDGD
jgi:hypothetical protein